MVQVAPTYHNGLIGEQPAPAEAAVAARRLRREGGFPVSWLITPGALWLLIFLIVPLVSIIIFSFWTSTGHGIAADLTLQNYSDYFYREGFFDPDARGYLTPAVFLTTLWTTFRFTLEVMFFCLIIGYPIAFFLAMQVKSFKWQMALFVLALVPFWTSYLIRAVAWLPMLGRRGLLNGMLLNLGIIDKPATFLLYSEFSYTMALVQLYVVLSIGPVFFSLAKINPSILEAARDMGATRFQIFREIIGPLSLPGVAIGMVFIFVMIMGEFATAVVVYGGKTSTTGTVILNYYAIANYPFAAVNAIMLMLAMMLGVVLILRAVNIRKEL